MQPQWWRWTRSLTRPVWPELRRPQRYQKQCPRWRRWDQYPGTRQFERKLPTGWSCRSTPRWQKSDALLPAGQSTGSLAREPSGTIRSPWGWRGTATLYRWRACKKLDQLAYVKACVILCAWVTNWESQEYLQTRSSSIKRDLRGWVWKSSPISGASQFPKVCWACPKLHLLSCSAQKKPTGHRCTYWDLLGRTPSGNPSGNPSGSLQNGDMDSRSHPLGNLACHDKWPVHIYKMETIAWPKKAVQSTIQCWHEDAHEDVCQIARKRFNVIQGIEVISLSVLCHGLYKCANVLYQSLGQHGFEAFPNVQISHVAMLGMGKELEFRKEQTGDKWDAKG